MSQNCYAYAIGYADRIDPGELSGAKYTDNSDAALRDAAENDGLEYVGNTLPAGKPGSRIVALVATSADTDNYHWIRMESDRTWSHKPGQGNPSRSDANGVALDDGHLPHQGDFRFRNYYAHHPKLSGLLAMAVQQGWALDYDRFSGYFYCPNAGLKKVKKDGGCQIQ